MKSAKKWWMQLLVGLMMGISIVPVAWANTATVDGITWTYTVKNGEASLGYYAVPTSTSGAITIPSSLADYRVTSIGTLAFVGCSGLTSVAIPDSVRNIGHQAFDGCSNLTEVSIPNSVTNIGSYAFRGCSRLMHITIPDSVTSTGDQLFYACNGLTSVSIGEGMTSIKSWMFWGCNALTNVTIGNNVTRIEHGAFSGCSRLTNVTIPDSVTNIGNYAFGGCSGLTNVTIPNSVISIGSYAFRGCSGLTNVTIPDSVISIGSYAFRECGKLEDISVDSQNPSYSSSDGVLFSRDKTTLFVFPEGKQGHYAIPDCVTKVESYAFYGCSGITNVMIGGCVTNIGFFTFCGCNGLESIITGSKNPVFSSLDGVLFSQDKTELIVFPGGKQGAYAIPDSVTDIGDYAFDGCKGLASVTLGEGITNIGYSAFYGCRGLTGVTIPANMTRIGYEAFAKCTRLKTFEVSDGNAAYTSRDGVLFSKDMGTLVCYPGGKVGVYSIPADVKSIGPYAFSWCAGLKSVSVPSSLQSIGSYAFLGCSGIETFFMPLSWEGKSLGYPCLRAKCQIIYGTPGAESVAETTWHYFIQGDSASVLEVDARGDVAIPGHLGGFPVTSIAPYAFHGCKGLTSVTIPVGVTNIGHHAFCGCEGLAGVEIPSGVTAIGDDAFSGCNGLTELAIPDTVQHIGQFAFHGCTGLTNLMIGAGVEEIGRYAFAKCRGLASMTIPDNVRIIGDHAFYSCTGLADLVLPNGVERMGSLAFADCDGLESVTIPASVAELGDHPFAACNGLLEIAVEPDNGLYASNDGVLFSKDGTVLFGFPAGRGGGFAIPDEVEAIGDYAFDDCDGLTALEVDGGNANFASRDGALFSKDMQRLLVCPAGKAGAFAVPEGVPHIEDRAFADCQKLTRILIPGSVESMGTNSLYRCDGLVALFVPPAWADGRDGNQTLKGARIQAGWKIIHGALEFETLDGVEWHWCAKDGGAVVLPGDYGADVVIPAMLGGHPVTGIGHYAFYGCGELEKVAFPGSVTNIGDYAFYTCENLKSVTLPDSVQSIGKWAFSACKGLKNIQIPDGVATIGDRAFFGCSGLSEAAIPDSVARIGVNAFYGNSELTALKVGDNNANYASQDGVLFSKDMEKLLWCPDGKAGEYTIPDGVKTLAYRAFGDCIGLTRGTMPESVEKIGRNAFYGCRGMAVLYVPASWEVEAGWLEMLARAKLPPECRIVYLKDKPEEATSTTPVPVPFGWLEENAKEILVKNDWNYEAAAGATAANGLAVWKCYLAGLAPECEDAWFMAKLAFVDGRAVVQWEPDLNGTEGNTNRVYRVYGKKDFANPAEEWADVTDTEDLEAEGWGFFRVGVEWGGIKGTDSLKESSFP